MENDHLDQKSPWTKSLFFQSDYNNSKTVHYFVPMKNFDQDDQNYNRQIRTITYYKFSQISHDSFPVCFVRDLS